MTHTVFPLKMAVTAIPAFAVLADDQRRTVLAICQSRVVAERVAELLDRCGLVDIPDTLEGEVAS